MEDETKSNVNATLLLLGVLGFGAYALSRAGKKKSLSGHRMSGHNFPDNIIDLIKTGYSKDKRKVEVTFYPPYDKKIHDRLNLTKSRIKSLKNSKVEVFDVLSEMDEIVALSKSPDVKSMKWV